MNSLSGIKSSLTPANLTLSIQARWQSLNPKMEVLKLASYLTDPVCKVREYFYRYYIINHTCQTTAQKVTEIAHLTFGIIFCSLLAPLTTPWGIVLRAAVRTFEDKPFVFLKKEGVGKTLPHDKKITVLSYNVCFQVAGYSITDGQVTPPSDKKRVDANVQVIKDLNPDIVCLHEVVDSQHASYLTSQLKEYPYVIPIAGVRAIGPTSMLYVASKYEIDEKSIEFSPFIKNKEITGRAKFAEKGVISFDLKNPGEDRSFASVFTTHLQNSEIPDITEGHEVNSRKKQMLKIANLIERKIKKDQNVIFTGDLNQDEKELNKFCRENKIKWLRRDKNITGVTTWQGDKWSSNLMQRKVSWPQVLDYTFIAGKTKDISTEILDSGYDHFIFKADAKSDHQQLFSTITLG